jgi:rsbT co-antagonist protein RsbR
VSSTNEPRDEDRADIAVANDARGPLLGASRALLYSHVSVDMLRKQLVHQLGEDLSRAIVAQAGRHGGFHDAQVMLQERSFDRVEDMLEMQYRFLTASGFGRFEMVALSVERSAKEVYVRVRCSGSPEAESHHRLFGTSSVPSCWHLVGYSTGWASAVTGLQLLSVESRCVAKGDDYCEVETLPYSDFVGPEASFWKRAFESTSTSMAEELRDKLATIERQLATIQQQRDVIASLSSPVLQVADDLIVVPVIGAIDASRARAMTERLLREVSARAARGVIVDVTGVEDLDGDTAAHLLSMEAAVRMLGAEIVVTGIAPAVAQVLAAHGGGLMELATRLTLQDGIRLLRVQAHSH